MVGVMVYAPVILASMVPSEIDFELPKSICQPGRAPQLAQSYSSPLALLGADFLPGHAVDLQTPATGLKILQTNLNENNTSDIGPSTGSFKFIDVYPPRVSFGNLYPGQWATRDDHQPARDHG